jgi:hypothetical protein
MSSRSISAKQMEALLKLPGPGRYDHFIKSVVDREQAWGLWNNGWAMGRDDAQRSTFPLWPAREYAALSAVGEWAGYQAAEIPLDDLINELLPKLERDGVQASIFRTSRRRGRHAQHPPIAGGH